MIVKSFSRQLGDFLPTNMQACQATDGTNVLSHSFTVVPHLTVKPKQGTRSIGQATWDRVCRRCYSKSHFQWRTSQESCNKLHEGVSQPTQHSKFPTIPF